MAGTMGVDYYTSLAACQAMGASLLTLDSPEKVQALQDAGLFPAIPGNPSFLLLVVVVVVVVWLLVWLVGWLAGW